MVETLQKSGPALAALGAGALVGVIAIVLGSVIYTGEGYGSEPTPPEQIYFF